MADRTRTSPNVLVTGTPGTGKSTMARELATQTGLRLVDVGEIVKEKHLHQGWDEELQSYILDEDRVRARRDGACESPVSTASVRVADARRARGMAYR